MKARIALLLLLSPASGLASEFDYKALVGLIQVEKLESIEAVLPRLPEARANYTLMYESRSLQGATLQAPRAILFGKDAKLTCAFNGDASERGFDSLECFQYLEKDRRFDFRQIQFPTPSNGLKQVRFSSSNHSADGKVACTSCHAADPRPNWDRYSIWPGAYGMFDDDLSSPIGYAKDFEGFVKQRDTHPRYRWLVQPEGALSPYLGDHKIGSRPNLRFSSLANRMNAFRAERLLVAGAKPWQALAFASQAMKCGLTLQQQSRLQAAGIGTSLPGLALDVFHQLGLKPNEWSTKILADGNDQNLYIYEHYAGFGSLPVDAALVLVSELAAQGNTVLAGEAQAIRDSYAPYNGDALAFFQILNSFVPDNYPEGYKGSTRLCDELTRLFVDAATSP